MGLFFFFGEDLHDAESSRVDKVICGVMRILNCVLLFGYEMSQLKGEVKAYMRRN
jgi:hypothetical protein